jgi:two-component system cell cycle sensor histidine kinase/response regulator CckA
MEPAPSLARGEGELILVADDEENVRNVTCGTLEKFGYQTLRAKDGTETIALFAENRDRIGAVLTDLAMPNLDGATAIRVLRQLKPDVAIIAVSGLASPDKTVQLQSLKVNALLAKPFTIEKLLRTVAEVLKKN